jgi:prevent-host-death family protein
MSEEVISIYNAKTGFSQLITRVEDGERITISRHGRPVARLVPLAPERVRREPGVWRGQIESLDGTDSGPGTSPDRGAGPAQFIRDWFGR